MGILQLFRRQVHLEDNPAGHRPPHPTFASTAQKLTDSTPEKLNNPSKSETRLQQDQKFLFDHREIILFSFHCSATEKLIILSGIYRSFHSCNKGKKPREA